MIAGRIRDGCDRKSNGKSIYLAACAVSDVLLEGWVELGGVVAVSGSVTRHDDLSVL